MISTHRLLNMLMNAALSNNIGRIKEILEKAGDQKEELIRLADDHRLSPLKLATKNGHAEAIAILIWNGADVNKTHYGGRTFAFIAAQGGHIEAIKALIKAGVDINKSDDDGVTPAQAAEHQSHGNVVKFITQFNEFGKILKDALSKKAQSTDTISEIEEIFLEAQKEGLDSQLLIDGHKLLFEIKDPNLFSYLIFAKDGSVEIKNDKGKSLEEHVSAKKGLRGIVSSTTNFFSKKSKTRDQERQNLVDLASNTQEAKKGLSDTNVDLPKGLDEIIIANLIGEKRARTIYGEERVEQKERSDSFDGEEGRRHQDPSKPAASVQEATAPTSSTQKGSRS